MRFKLNPVFTYVSEELLSARVYPHSGVNEFGNRLLNLCKASGLRMSNGRDKEMFYI